MAIDYKKYTIKMDNPENLETCRNEIASHGSKENEKVWESITKSNRQAKIEMANKLIRLGFTPELAYRIFNIEEDKP